MHIRVLEMGVRRFIILVIWSVDIALLHLWNSNQLKSNKKYMNFASTMSFCVFGNIGEKKKRGIWKFESFWVSEIWLMESEVEASGEEKRERERHRIFYFFLFFLFWWRERERRIWSFIKLKVITDSRQFPLTAQSGSRLSY